MKKKSSLKTFLAGKNPFDKDSQSFPSLKGSEGLIHIVGYKEADNNSTHHGSTYGETWYIDVLGDGTAITYCKDL